MKKYALNNSYFKNRQFSVVEREDMREEFERTKARAEIVVIKKL